MSADEARDKSSAAPAQAKTGPRHAAPRKPLFTRFHVPAGKAMALAAMPTAVLMGMGFTPTLARADDHSPAKSLTVDEYQKCVEAVDGSQDSKDASTTPSPTASASASKSADTAEPTPSASANSGSDKTSSSDSGSDDKATPKPSASSSSASSSDTSSGSGTSPASPSASASGSNVLEDIGNAIKDIFTPGDSSSASASTTPSPSASASATQETKDTKDTSDTVKDTTKKVTDTVKDAVKDTTDTATKAASRATEAASDAVKSAESATASPSASATTSAEDCPAATDDESGVEKIVALPDAPWRLEASSLTLKGADYQGIVKVRTANGTIKKVLKYVISDGTDIGDLHQLVDGPNGVTYHVQAARGSHSTITGGKTVMYTESISGNLLGLIPLTFTPDNPPPLNIPLIYFTNVKVTQAGQFGGTLTIPGMRQYTTGTS
ncbi:hypothetical protein ACFOZ0_20040 [Streptomyces yaanensis]|uniref:Membrane-bound hydrophilic protein n=1 Tax=Streptomyces yaanensis TaxID=1142239 RepID=A0ABV7SI45_9ACTN|nr:hypothetical protein [Streptomyces sp. CGMCC 4.7035]WNB97857.1 hypothetical protein Q2K21_07060 [Streptomyces sp. CGMCC 4.7035]